MNRTLPLFCLTCCCLLVFFQNSFATIYYVTSAGAGTTDGSTWANAETGDSLQNIIDAASAGDTVWIACGIYFPTTSTDRSISFAMKNGVLIFGSFAGTETDLSERSFACNPCTILSGAIGTAAVTDNSYTVVYNPSGLDSTAVLDGFTIQYGYDDRSPTSAGNGLGGGIYNHGYAFGGSCSPTIRNCYIRDNVASWGAGIFNNGYNLGYSAPTIVNCVITENHALIEAGGIDSYGVGGTVEPTIINTLVYKNTAATNVGGMYCWGGNSGGNCNLTMINSAFINNRSLSGYCGGAIVDNTDENGVTISGSATYTVWNSIFWGNTADFGGQQFHIRGDGTFNATYTSIDSTGHSPGSSHPISGPGTGNLFTYPMFVDSADGDGADNCWFSDDDGLRLANLSNAINTGDTTDVYETDILGNMRQIGYGVDLGPYEMPIDTMYWDGSSGTVWNLDSNWTPFGLTDSTHVVVIRGTSTATNQPVIDNTNEKCQELIMETDDNAALQINGTGTLDIIE